ncbi:MAG: hypothetical protein LIO46_00055 [Clostridiales bacterium]|nr:hypothetical protein [Clostridiales bacterium]
MARQGYHTHAYNSNNAYNLSGFEAQRAPVRVPQPQQRKPKLEVVEHRPRSREQLAREERIGYAKALKLTAVSAVLILLMGMVIYSGVQKNILTHEITSTKRQLEIAESEYVRLSMTLNSMVSVDNIEAYATQKLGMVKAQNSQITFVDVAGAKQAQDQPDSQSDDQAQDAQPDGTAEE